MSTLARRRRGTDVVTLALAGAMLALLVAIALMGGFHVTSGTLPAQPHPSRVPATLDCSKPVPATGTGTGCR